MFASVNARIDKDSSGHFNLTFPNIDHITNQIKKKVYNLCKVDISPVFCHVKVDLSDYDLLELKWSGVSYIDTCLPF